MATTYRHIIDGGFLQSPSVTDGVFTGSPDFSGATPIGLAGGANSPSYDRIDFGYDLYTPNPQGVLPGYVYENAQITAVAHTCATAANGSVDVNILLNGGTVHTITLNSGSTSAVNAGLAIAVSAGDVISVDPVTAAPSTPSQFGNISVRIETLVPMSSRYDRVVWGYEAYSSSPAGIASYNIFESGTLEAVAHTVATTGDPVTFDIKLNTATVATIGGGDTASTVNAGLGIAVTAGQVITVLPTTATPTTPPQYGLISARLVTSA